MRKRIPVKSIDGVDRVRLEWNEGMEKLCIPVEDSGDEEEEDDEVVLTSGISNDKNAPGQDEFEKEKHLSYNDKFVNDVLNIKYVRKAFGRLTMRQRRLRMREMAMYVLSATVDRKEFAKNKSEYLNDNESLAIDILNLLDGMKEYLQFKLKVNFSKIKRSPMLPLEGDKDGLIEDGLIREKKSRIGNNIIVRF